MVNEMATRALRRRARLDGYRYRVPTGRKITAVDLLRRLERLACSLRSCPPERAQQHPLTSEPHETKSVVCQFGLPFRVEVQIDGDLLDEPAIGGPSARLLDPVRHERGEHLDLTDTG